MAHQHPKRPDVASSDVTPLRRGAVAQLGERRLCKAEVGGSSPPGSTNWLPAPVHGTGQAHYISGKRSRDVSRRQRPRREQVAPGRHLHNGRAHEHTSYKYTVGVLRRAGNRRPARDPRGSGRVRWQLRSRECLTKGQATKGAWRMPRRHGPMKDVARLRKAPASCLASSTGDLRMGQPGPLYRGSRPAEHIGRIEGTGGTETSQYPEEKKQFS